MRRIFAVGLATLSILGSAGAAGAAVMHAEIGGLFTAVQAPHGALADQIILPYDTVLTSGGRDTIFFGLGGIGFHIAFDFDTDLGNLTTTADTQTLSWTSGSGVASPLLDAEFTGFGEDLDLHGLTSFSVSRSPYFFSFGMQGDNFSFSEGMSLLVPGPPIPLSEAFSKPDLTEIFANGGFNDGTFSGAAAYVSQVDFSPVAGIPEPGIWASMILGFSAVGLALRRARRGRRTSRPAAPGVLQSRRLS